MGFEETKSNKNKSDKNDICNIYQRQMRHFIFFSITVLMWVSTELLSQNNICNCTDNLNELIEKTEANYAGFPAKVTDQTRSKYNLMVRNLKRKGESQTNPLICYNLLRVYVRYFRDKHFILSFEGNNRPDSETIPVLEEEYRRYFSKNGINPIEGIWIDPEYTTKIAIKRKKENEFYAVILKSEDPNLPVGLIYYTFTKKENKWVVQEYNSYLSTDIVAKLKENLLQIWNQKMFGKIFPTKMSKVEQEELNTWKNKNNGLAFKILSSKTAYLKIPTFKNNDDRIMQLVTQNDSVIRRCENLILDLTSNGGGNTGWVPLLPYLMTNPIIQYSSYLRVTPENVKYKLADLEPFVIQPIPDEYKKYFPDETLSAYKKAYQELPDSKSTFYPIPGVNFPLDSILKNPKRVALIVDDLCGSSAEYFFFISKQSKKTITYGINTIGMMDYEGMSNPTAMPYDKFIVTIPISKSSWTDKKPIDNSGFQPDILLNSIDPKKWVDFVQQDMESK